MPHRRTPLIAACLSAPLLAAAGGTASGGSIQPEDEYGDLVVASAFAEQSGVTPGGTVWVGIHFQIQDGWHTYWPGQNDTGFGTQIDIEASEGVSVGSPRWPAPKRYTSPGDILDHVHETAVTALLPVTVGTDFEPGSAVQLSFDLSWLVCDDVCIPGWETVTLALPIIASPTMHTGDVSELFANARVRIPESNADINRASVSWDGNSARIRATDAKNLAFYPDEGGSFVSDLINAGEASSDVIKLSFDSQDPVLSGVLEVHESGGKVTFVHVRSSPKDGDAKP